MVLFVILPIIFLCSFVLTFLIKNYATKKSIIDIPNERSSHSLPTPRGGGLSFVIVFLLSTLIANYLGIAPIHIGGYGLLSIITISFLGFYDDKNALSPLFRLVIQFVAVLVFVLSISPLPSFETHLFVIKSGYLLNVLMILYLLWLLNLYNFMDGINGISSLEAVSVGIGMCGVYGLTGHLDLLPNILFLVVAVLGFLPLNFPAAKIFMGDVGSSFLGFVIGVFSLQAFIIDRSLFWSWLVLLGVFIVDSSVTLITRTINGNKIYQAHCTHAYQNSARRLGSHTLVTLIVTAINILWLLPIAIMIGLHYVDGFYGLLIAYVPLSFICYRLGAGR